VTEGYSIHFLKTLDKGKGM